jgi:DNA polymerase I
MKSPLYLLDSHAVIYRAYFAFLNRPLKSPDGRNVSAVFGFFRILFALFDERNPERFACVFDSRTPTFRHEMYDQYKANRAKTPEDLHPQADMIEELLNELGVPVLRQDGFEADDIIATMAEACRAEGRECYVISADKDLLQLVGGPVKVLRPGKDTGYSVIGPEEVNAEWGVSPERILDILSLTGDASDNIPGVPGIGDKTAVKLISEYGTLDDIYAKLDSVKPEGTRKKLEAGRESAYFSRQLVRLKDDMDLGGVAPDSLAVGQLRGGRARELFLGYGMRQLAARFGKQDELFPAPGPEGRPEPTAPVESVEGFASGIPVEVDPELLGKGSYACVTDEKSLRDWVDSARKAGSFSFDCETDSLDDLSAKPLGFSLAISPKIACYVPIHSPDAKCLPESEIKAALQKLLGDPSLTMIGQNLKYDIHVMESYGVPTRCALRDSMVAAWLLDSGRASYALGNLAERYLGDSGTSFESIVPKGGSFADVPIAQAAAYAAEDADFALRLMLAFEPALKKAGLWELFSGVEMPLVPVLAEMERSGIRLDKKALAAYSIELERGLAAVEAEIYQLVGHEFNINSPKQLQEVLFVERKLKTGKKTKTGFSTDVSVLEELALEDPVPALILKNRTLAKLKSTYVDTLPELADAQGRVHTHYMQAGTATGRLSSRDPNLQNIPIREEEGRRIREAFIAAPGCFLVSCDYSQIELVVLAHLSGDPGLKEAFTKNADIHKRTAALILGVPESEVSADKRRMAKTINFGVIYGMSAFRLANELKIPRGQAQEFIDAYFETYKGVREFTKKTVEEAEKSGSVKTILGRLRFVDGIASKNKTEKAGAERIAVNTPIQGSAADIVKVAMLAVHKALRERAPEAKILLQVHDELIIECPREIAETVKEIAKREMEKAIELSVPLRVSVESALSWGEMH